MRRKKRKIKSSFFIKLLHQVGVDTGDDKSVERYFLLSSAKTVTQVRCERTAPIKFAPLEIPTPRDKTFASF